MPGRTGQQCAQRWRHKVRRAPSLPARAVGRSQRPARPRADDCRAARVQVNPIIRKDKWTEEEDQKVRLAAHPHPHPWRSVARGRRRVPSLCATVFCGGRILWGGWEGVKGKRQWRAHARARRGHARARAGASQPDLLPAIGTSMPATAAGDGTRPLLDARGSPDARSSRARGLPRGNSKKKKPPENFAARGAAATPWRAGQRGPMRLAGRRTNASRLCASQVNPTRATCPRPSADCVRPAPTRCTASAAVAWRAVRSAGGHGAVY